MLTFLAENYGTILMSALAVVGGCSVAAAALSKLTANTTDDKVAAVLAKVQAVLSKLALNPKP